MFALIISGALVLSRVLNGRWTALPLFAIPLLYNYVFLVGLMNYIFGIAWRCGPWPAGSRCASGPGRYGSCCRPPASLRCSFAISRRWAFMPIGVLSFEIVAAVGTAPGPLAGPDRGFRRRGLPFLAVAPLLYASPTMQLSGRAPPHAHPTQPTP